MKLKRTAVFTAKSWTPMQGMPVENYIHNIFRNLTFVDNIEGFERVSEGPWEYSEVCPKDHDTVFEGYFQSSKNFFGFNEQIRDLFSPSEAFVAEMNDRYPELSLRETLSIHVRRGDFLKHSDIHPVTTEKYIGRALEEIERYSHVFIFSDDKQWARASLKLRNSTYVEDEDHRELWMMSLCKNHIMANSSFSWWGTFLSPSRDKKIIAPSIWFGPMGIKNYKDIYEPYWKVLEVNYDNGWLS